MKLLAIATTLTAIGLAMPALAVQYDLPFKGQNFTDNEKIYTRDHAVTTSQQYGFDFSGRRYDFDNSRWTSVNTTLAVYDAAPTNNKHTIYSKSVYAMRAGRVVGCWRNAPENPRPKLSTDSDVTRPWLHADFKAGLIPGGGNMLWVEHDDGSRMLYAHMIPGSIGQDLCPHNASLFPAPKGRNSEFIYVGVEPAQQALISKGQYLGRVGNSGSSTGPHLHVHLQNSSGVGQAISFSRGIATVPDNTKPYGGPWVRFAGSTIPAGAQLIWAPRTVSSRYARHAVKAEAYQSLFTHLSDSGFKPSWLDGYNVSGNVFYNMVWQPSNIGWRSYHGRSSASYQAVFNDAIADGFVPVHVDSHITGSGPRYSVIFEKKALATLARHNLSYAQHAQVMEQAKDLGMRPVSVSVVSSGGERRYTTLYHNAPVGSWTISSQLSSAAYQNKVLSEEAAGRRPIYVTSYLHHGNVNYSAVFAQLPLKTWEARHGQSSATYQNNFNMLGGQGFAIDVVSGIDGLNVHRFAAIWTK
ncbi:MAG: hypothetical protein KKE30_19970 [Gammaproteobacteria bacterium]|nr:hypothetical protein [Gammaproteobacteria bacterium]MBU1555726.1 hypothetical protein [Gammaproteobacteria bacterium]MBU2069304.1 hypothetical protein [Gammaproteobacteria bacterium]MBU2183299.1 hypothetical protein [Gammaproteobacteria bacterium]MBU2204514.1 hypothetical protein [Gammaproteobacteria bacterium]